jgi:hypothetical protein
MSSLGGDDFSTQMSSLCKCYVAIRSSWLHVTVPVCWQVTAALTAGALYCLTVLNIHMFVAVFHIYHIPFCDASVSVEPRARSSAAPGRICSLQPIPRVSAELCSLHIHCSSTGLQHCSMSALATSTAMLISMVLAASTCHAATSNSLGVTGEV